MKKSKAQTRSLFESRGDLCFFGLAILTIIFIAGYFLCRPLADPDFWWHLKTGELIYAKRSLLSVDPFNFTSDPRAVGAVEHFLLNAYWLWQLLAYGFYQVGGVIGIKLLSFLVLLSTYAVIGGSLLRNRIRATTALALIVVSLFLYARLFYLERPQMVTFLFSALLIVFFVEIRKGARPSLWLYPAMILWANMHGGVVVGTLLLGLFALGSCRDFRHEPRQRQRILWWCAAGIVVAGVNPSGFEFFGFTTRSLMANVADVESVLPLKEFISPFAHLATFPSIYIPLLLLVFAHIFALCRGWRRRALADWLVSSFLIVLSVMYLRNLAFVVVALVPMTAYLLHDSLDFEQPITAVAERWVAYGVVLFVTIASLAFAMENRLWSKDAWTEIDGRIFPEGVARFLDAVPIHGNMFNEYGWGGFLLWELYPKYQLFIDGRNFNEQARIDYAKIYQVSLDNVDGRREYEVLLEKYAIDIVTLAVEVDYTAMNPLLKFLLAKPDWHPVYFDGQGFVLVRGSENNRQVIARFGIEKSEFLDHLLAFYNANILENPDDYRRYFGRGELLGYLGRYAEAERDFAVVKQLDPENRYLPLKIRQLERLRDSSGITTKNGDRTKSER